MKVSKVGSAESFKVKDNQYQQLSAARADLEGKQKELLGQNQSLAEVSLKKMKQGIFC